MYANTLLSIRKRVISPRFAIGVVIWLNAFQAMGQSADPPWKPAIPKTWDDAVMKDLELPLANPEYSPQHMTAEYYYQIPVREIYRTYPVYHPDHEPAGYLEKLKTLEPEVVFRPEDLKSEEDWIRAGALIFNDPILPTLGGDDEYAQSLYVRDRQWHGKVNAPITKNGIMPFYRYTIRNKGEVQLGVLACASCHTRVLPDGTTIIGGQGNFPMDRAIAYDYRHGETLAGMRQVERLLYAADWTGKDSEVDSTQEAIIGRHEAIPPGVMARHRTDPRFPVVVPDLFDLEHRNYLGPHRTTAAPRHRRSDAIRYAQSRWRRLISLRRLHPFHRVYWRHDSPSPRRAAGTLQRSTAIRSGTLRVFNRASEKPKFIYSVGGSRKRSLSGQRLRTLSHSAPLQQQQTNTVRRLRHSYSPS